MREIDEFISDPVKYADNIRVDGHVVVKKETQCKQEPNTPHEKSEVNAAISSKNQQMINVGKAKVIADFIAAKRENGDLLLQIQNMKKNEKQSASQLEHLNATSKKMNDDNRRMIEQLRRQNKDLAAKLTQLNRHSVVPAPECDDNPFYEVGKILDDRAVNEYFVHWKGYPESENSWVKETDLSCRAMLRKYIKSKGKTAAKY